MNYYWTQIKDRFPQYIALGAFLSVLLLSLEGTLTLSAFLITFVSTVMIWYAMLIFFLLGQSTYLSYMKRKNKDSKEP